MSTDCALKPMPCKDCSCGRKDEGGVRDIYGNISIDKVNKFTAEDIQKLQDGTVESSCGKC